MLVLTTTLTSLLRAAVVAVQAATITEATTTAMDDVSACITE